MKTRNVSTLLTLAIIGLALAWNAPLDAQDLKGREVLGLRIGGLITSGSFNDEFGNGSEIELHFAYGITEWLGLEFALSSHNFGESLDEGKNLVFFDRTDVNLQMFSVGIGMIAYRHVTGRVTSTFEGGPALYSVNAILPQGFYDLQKTDNHAGLYGGVGVLVKVANSVSLNLNGKYHAVFVGSASDDTFHFYTGENTARFFQIAVGIVLMTG